MSDKEIRMIREFLSWNPPYNEPHSVSELAVTYLAQTVAEIDRLRELLADILEQRTAWFELHQKETTP